MNPIEQIAKACGGKVEIMELPDGSGCCVMSLELPKNHWIYETDKDGFCLPPPMPFRMGTKCKGNQTFTLNRETFANAIREAGKYAIRASTGCGKEMDFDPDAMLCNFIVGLLGYHTEDGLSSDSWANPPKQ